MEHPVAWRWSRAAAPVLLALLAGSWHQALRAASGEACLFSASTTYGVNPWVLRAILWNESRFDPKAVNHNANGSRDMGIGQVNSVHLPALQRHGIGEEHLLDLCTGVNVSAWLLRAQMDRYGNTWFAVGAYHSVTPSLNARYAQRIKETLRSWGVLGPQPSVSHSSVHP